MTLVDDITNDLDRRLRQRRASPEQLTLAALASEYGVSATPVRQALARLEEQGLLERHDNGTMRPSGAPPARTARRRRSQRSSNETSQLTDAVEREVLRRSMRGDHEFLREEAFAERLGVGRTQLRRVLHALAGAGVVEHVERRGWRARPFHHDDMLAFLDVRATLESQALDLARPHLESEAIERFLSGNDGDAIAAGAIDNALHAYFVERAGNHYLTAFFASHGRYYARLFDFAAVDADRLEEMAGQHTDILHHVRSKHWARARTALQHHIHSQAPVLGAAIDRLTSRANH